MDKAYWITWYNLPAEGRDAYLSWLHGHYIPVVLARPGILWGAHYASESKVVPMSRGTIRLSHSDANPPPAGDRYILMFGATEMRTLCNPAPAQYHAGLANADRDMLALREGERVNLMVEDGRVDGPEAAAYQDGLKPGYCIQLGSFNCASYLQEEEMAAWYAQWRLPTMQSRPGCIRVRKLVSVSGWAKHACFYEFTSLAIRNANPVTYGAVEMQAWKTVVERLIHAPGSSNVAQRLWPPINGR